MFYPEQPGEKRNEIIQIRDEEYIKLFLSADDTVLCIERLETQSKNKNTQLWHQCPAHILSAHPGGQPCSGRPFAYLQRLLMAPRSSTITEGILRGKYFYFLVLCGTISAVFYRIPQRVHSGSKGHLLTAVTFTEIIHGSALSPSICCFTAPLPQPAACDHSPDKLLVP